MSLATSGPPAESWTFSPSPPFTRRPFACCRLRPSSTVCLVFRCRWLVTSTAARRRIAIRHFLKAGSRASPFSGWKSKVRCHRSRGRRLHTMCCSTISGPRSLPRIRPKTHGVCCGASCISPHASRSPKKHLFASSSLFSSGSSREAGSLKRCSPVTRRSYVPATSSICANRLIPRLVISINTPLPRGCRIS